MRAALHTSHKQSHRERLGHLAVDLDPTKILLVDPKLAFHVGEHFPVLAVYMIAKMRSGLKYVDRPAFDYLFADQLEVEQRTSNGTI